uniref:Uncharacterized protein n=1 Tax=Brassica oleracea TaxID=3712 RepID=A0A3P6FAA2_BRAOL|nr:unnamed protein product [Brassica oleracea]
MAMALVSLTWGDQRSTKLRSEAERSPSFPPVGYDARCCDASAKQISAPKIIHSHCTRKG